MPVNITSPKGEAIDVEAVADAAPEDAFLLLSDESMIDIVDNLSSSTRQELGELLVVLADVVAKSADSYPIARIDVRSTPTDDNDLQATVTVDRSGQTVFKRITHTIIDASVDGVQGLWEHVCAEQSDGPGKTRLSLSFLMCLTDLVRTITHTLPSFIVKDKPKK
jgi:hypothetical protein